MTSPANPWLDQLLEAALCLQQWEFVLHRKSYPVLTNGTLQNHRAKPAGQAQWGHCPPRMSGVGTLAWSEAPPFVSTVSVLRECLQVSKCKMSMLVWRHLFHVI